MARFHDKVGYSLPGAHVGGVWTANIVERDYTGEVPKAMSSYEPAEKVNSDIRLQNRISIVADAFAFANFSNIKYVSWNGTRWEVQSIEIDRPRLMLTLGGVYNGPIPAVEAPSTP